MLTDKQRDELHKEIYYYLKAQPGEEFALAASTLHHALKSSCHSDIIYTDVTNLTKKNNLWRKKLPTTTTKSTLSVLENKWIALARIQRMFAHNKSKQHIDHHTSDNSKVVPQEFIMTLNSEEFDQNLVLEAAASKGSMLAMINSEDDEGDLTAPPFVHLEQRQDDIDRHEYDHEQMYQPQQHTLSMAEAEAKFLEMNPPPSLWPW